MKKLYLRMLNITGNSIRHGNTKNLSISVTDEDDEGCVRFTISDNG